MKVRYRKKSGVARKMLFIQPSFVNYSLDFEAAIIFRQTPLKSLKATKTLRIDTSQILSISFKELHSYDSSSDSGNDTSIYLPQF